MNAHIGIAGGGMVGRLLAWRLLRSGFQVTVVERDTPGSETGAGFVAAGMLAPWAESAVGPDHLINWGAWSIERWSEWSAALGLESFARNGTLVVAHPRDRSNLLQFERILRSRGVASPHMEIARPKALEPGLSLSSERAIFLPGEGHIDPQDTLRRVKSEIEALGGHWLTGLVTALRTGCLRVDDRELPFDRVVDCRGLGARTELPGLRGVRGEVLVIRSDEIRLSRPVRLLHPRYALYVVPRSQGRFVVGATELESDDSGPMTVRSALELLSAVFALNPAFGEARIESLRTGLRPALPDNAPVIYDRQGVLTVNGLYRHGVLLTPVVVETACARIEGRPPPLAGLSTTEDM